jgi:hypothetical protein
VIERAKAATERLRKVMGWPETPSGTHPFEVIRMLWKRYEAVPVKVEYIEELANRIEKLEFQNAAKEVLIKSYREMVERLNQ